jgi:hypothetical protein
VTFLQHFVGFSREALSTHSRSCLTRHAFGIWIPEVSFFLDGLEGGFPMTNSEVKDFSERQSSEATSSRRKYVVPTLSRYGTLGDLTARNGTKYGNDGSGSGCGQGNNHKFSCT